MDSTVPVPLPFMQLWDVAARAIHRSAPEQHGVLHVLPAPLRHIADAVEASAEFDDFLRTVLPDVRRSPWRVREALRRSGFYQAVRGGNDPERVWQLLVSRLKPHTVHLRTLVLLDGCWFPTDRFEIAGATIERVSGDTLSELGPPEEVAAVFFPNETLDLPWFSRVWFLTTDEERTVKPTGITVRFGYEVLRHFWEPILGLALYKTDYFGLPIVVEADPGWRIERIEWAEPASQLVDDNGGNTIEVPRTEYDVRDDETQRFAAFVSLFDEAIKVARPCKALRLGARRYLRANIIAGPYAVGDDYEDALLQYVFALEVLLSSGERGSIGDKLATRAAWLIGTNDTIRDNVYIAVKRLYSERSSIVHGSVSKHPKREARLLDEVRDLVRRVLLGLLALRRATTSDNECFGLLRTAAYNMANQAQLSRATSSVWPLVDPGIPGLPSLLGPVYERFEYQP